MLINERVSDQCEGKQNRILVRKMNDESIEMHYVDEYSFAKTKVVPLYSYSWVNLVLASACALTLKLS